MTVSVEETGRVPSLYNRNPSGSRFFRWYVFVVRPFVRTIFGFSENSLMTCRQAPHGGNNGILDLRFSIFD